MTELTQAHYGHVSTDAASSLHGMLHPFSAVQLAGHWERLVGPVPYQALTLATPFSFGESGQFAWLLYGYISTMSKQ